VTPVTPGGQCFFFLLVDNASSFMWVVLLPTKGEVVDAIKQVQATAEESGRKLWHTNGRVHRLLHDEGIQRHFSTPYSLQQNGVVFIRYVEGPKAYHVLHPVSQLVRAA
jgi:hypothetical protein